MDTKFKHTLKSTQREKPERRSPSSWRSRRVPTRRPAASTSWDPLARWYDGWMGQEGSYHHRKIAVPAVLELLDLKKGERVLDLGCGQGVLAESVHKAHAQYVGVDASPQLIELARQRHGEAGSFLVGDVMRLAKNDSLQAESFDAAVFLLSLQDMAELDTAIRNSWWALKPGGTLVILLTHPCFRIPRQSGWGMDEGRKLQYRRIDSYLTEQRVPLKSYPGKSKKGVSTSFHRPIQRYIEAITRQGGVIDGFRELTAEALLSEKTPRAERRVVQEIPLYLGLRARKLRKV